MTETLAVKCREAAGQLSTLYGDLALFCLVQHEGTAGKWDVVASAPWLTWNRAGIQQVVDALRQRLSKDDWLSIASVVPLPRENPLVQALIRSARLSYLGTPEADSGPFFAEVGPVTTDDLTIDRAIVIVADRAVADMTRPQAAPRQAVVA